MINHQDTKAPREQEVRVCDYCPIPIPVALIFDLSQPGYEYRCPECGRFDEWFGKSIPASCLSALVVQPL